MPRKPRPIYPSIRAYLNATGQTQAQFAQELGITPAHLSNILSKSRNCSVPLLLKMSQIANVPIEAIGGWMTNSETSVR